MAKRSGRMRDPDTLLRIVTEHAAKRPPAICTDVTDGEESPAMACYDAFPPQLRACVRALAIDGVMGTFAEEIRDAANAGYPETELIRHIRDAEAEYLKGDTP